MPLPYFRVTDVGVAGPPSRLEIGHHASVSSFAYGIEAIRTLSLVRGFLSTHHFALKFSQTFKASKDNLRISIFGSFGTSKTEPYSVVCLLIESSWSVSLPARWREESIVGDSKFGDEMMSMVGVLLKSNCMF